MVAIPEGDRVGLLVVMRGLLQLSGLVLFLADGFEETGRLPEMAAGPINCESRDSTDRDENTPDDVLRDMRRKHGCG